MKTGKWLPIEDVQKYVEEREMFVVKAFDVIPFEGQLRYTSDPWCVWLEVYSDGTEMFSRWPHSFKPTHFLLLPEGV